MQIRTDTKILAACLDTVEKALPLRSTIPVIGNILMEVSEGKLIFSATNLEIYLKTEMDYSGEEAGRILLPPKIVDIMRYFPTAEVNLSVNLENYRIEISGGSAQFHLFGSDADDYPLAFDQKEEELTEIELEKDIFKNVIRAVVFAASNEETRPAFNGILWTFMQDKISMIASDTYRLAVKDLINQQWSFPELRILCPARSFRELLKIIDDSDQPLKLKFNNKIIAFEFGNTYLASRLLEEKYPDVSGVIPKEYKSRIKINRRHLEESVNRSALLAEGKNLAVNLFLDGENLKIRVSGQEGSMEESIAVEKIGDDLSLFVNTRFVTEVLKVINQEEVIIDFHGEGGPLIFRAPEDHSYLYLVLPIKKVS